MSTGATDRVVHVRAPGKINVFMKVGSLLDGLVGVVEVQRGRGEALVDDHAEADEHRDRPGDEGDLISARAYRPGDSPRRIHWAHTSRRDMLIVSERQMASQRRLSLNTVIGAYRQLEDAGLVVPLPRSGFEVAARLQVPRRSLRDAPSEPTAPSQPAMIAPAAAPRLMPM